MSSVAILTLGCGLFLCKECSVDTAMVEGCIKSLESGNFDKYSREYSALKNLRLRFEGYNTTGDCEKFNTYFNAHAKPYCISNP